ncbi:MAG TPA: class I adenylate-forming enzyme family protein [Usitatibacter sp.]|nr:class I adenylate-forming enzyme family protein [Usitatibacter sp.]
MDRLEAIPAHWAGVRPDALALVEAAGGRTWRELDAARIAFARTLSDAGVVPGDRVMIVGENCAAMVALLFAVASLDAWIVNLNARLSAREVDAIREHARPRCVLFLPDNSPDAAAHAARLGAMAFGDDGWGSILRARPVEGCAPEVPEPDRAARVAALVYTTGTTGEPKGVMLTHRNVLFVARAAGQLRQLTEADRVFAVLPLSHVYGLSSVCLGSLMAGACLYLQPRFTPTGMRAALEVDRVTMCQGVPAMYTKYLEFLAAQALPLRAPGLRAIYCGGSPLAASVKRAVEEAFGLVLHNGYGLTEAAPTVSQTRHDAPRTDCSVGPALPGVDVRIVEPGGADAARGTVGELWVRGPNVMKGYYRDPRATAEALRNGGWLATGDLARVDADGALHIEGRSKELIIRSGFNVYPVEVEAVLNEHPHVSQSAVVGRELEGNEEVVAFVEPVPGTNLDAAALAAFAAQRLAPYKRPAEIIVMEKLPAAASGKLLKGRLKELARAR